MVAALLSFLNWERNWVETTSGILHQSHEREVSPSQKLTYRLIVFKQLGNQAHTAVVANGQNVERQRIAVALQKAVRMVGDGASIVINGEAGFVGLGRNVVAVAGKLGLKLLHQRFISSLGKTAFFIQQREDTQRLAKAQIQQRLVVHKGNVAAINAFALVLFQFVLEDLKMRETKNQKKKNGEFD